MKTLKFSIILLALFSSMSFAWATPLNARGINHNSGIFLTAFDYKHNKLSLAANQSTKNRFDLNDFFGGETLTVNHDGKNYRFSKDSIYGYKDKDGSDYRFYKSHSAEYKILESGKIVIYARELSGSKQTGFKPIVSYYFSNGANGEIYPLTLDHLKSIFKNQPAFDTIDGNFHSDNELVNFDKYHHVFRINHLLANI